MINPLYFNSTLSPHNSSIDNDRTIAPQQTHPIKQPRIHEPTEKGNPIKRRSRGEAC